MQLNQTYIKLCNVKIYCEYGINEKPPLLLIHGFASSIYTFNLLIPLLKEYFSIIAIDLPGFGRSEKSASFVYSFQNYAKIVADCMDYFKLKEVNIAGHSMGGQIALYTAKVIPEKIKNLVLLSSSGYLKRANRALIFCTYLPFFHYFIRRKVQSKEVREHLKNVFYQQSLITEDYIEEYGKPLQEEGFYISLMRLLRYREGDLSSMELKNITIPTLLLWGEEDQVVPVHIGHRLANDLPNAKLITYEKTGHLITEERSNEVFKEILNHILI
ncbi:alpha/beta fold hydrolase [Neobacillus mesonae]|uniref:alpha/beta fold hydrolase n=1 Tax=Neobacillus mesonae TaxID=1193713 RepID=UPI0020406D53|nr:alpha/beta hydrolase [Neobacillus mesonae]MCM3567041.1 alpha/beta hydrolase [Neobacillus mesonae]